RSGLAGVRGFKSLARRARRKVPSPAPQVSECACVFGKPLCVGTGSRDRGRDMQQFVKALVLVTLGLVIAAFAVSSPTLVRGAPLGDRPAAALSITLYGSFSSPAGWGWAATNITEPGPTLTVHQGDVITFHLFAHDAPTSRILVIDLNNNQVNDAGD